MKRLLALVLLLGTPGFASAATDVLPPEQAFQYEIDRREDALIVRWTVEPGYYLYKKRFSFDSPTPGVTLDAPRYPKGEIHTDEFFGESEIFRGKFDVEIPFTASSDARAAELAIGLQGCADLGLCYPPQEWTTEIPMNKASAGGGSNLLALLAKDPKFGGTGEFLHPDEAFVLSTSFEDSNTLRAHWVIADGYYLYKDKMRFTASDIQFGAARLPAGKPKYDEFFGDTEVYYGAVEALVPFSRPGPQSQQVAVSVQYQGCAEDGICYPPISRDITMMLPEANAATASRTLENTRPVSEQDRLAGLIRHSNLLGVMGTFFVLGLLLAFTPCVLPMVPIISGIIAGQGKDVTTGRAFALSLTYVLGMALTYTIAGAMFAAAGQQAQSFFQQAWIIIAFSGLFVVLALSMFGLFQLQMPASIQSRVADLSNRQRTGTFVGTAVIGALSALVVTACVAPPLVAALAVIGQSGDVYRGGAALFAMSMGMGAPLLVVGASAGKLLPKAGPWMETVKALFGVMMLGVAIWLLARIVPDWLTMLLWAGLAFAAAFVLGVFRSAPTAVGKLGRAFGVVAVAYGVLLLVGTATGSTDPLQPLKGLRHDGHAAHLSFQRIKSVADLEREIEGASRAGQPAMLDFYADWCVSCKEMEKYTFTDGSVHEALEGALLLQADVTANDEEDKALLKYFGIFGPPTIAFFNPSGEEMEAYRVVGFVPPAEFRDHVQEALGTK